MTTFLHGVELVELTDGARTIVVSSSSVIGLVGTAKYADPAAFPLDTPVLVTRASQLAPLTATAPAGATDRGTLPGAGAAIFDVVTTPVVVVRVDVSAVAATQMAEVVGSAATSQGVYAFSRAQTMLGVKPKILCAPGFTHQQPTVGTPPVITANPVVAALQAVAAKPGLRATVVTDMPNDSVTTALAKGLLEGDGRTWPIYPFVYSDVSPATPVPASARAAGVIAATDQSLGYWFSPSNQPIPGVTGLSQPVSFGLSDPSCDASLLNAGNVATLINQGGGFRLWGNQVGAADPAWKFLSVRRTADVFYDAFDAAFLYAMDKPFSAQLLRDILDEGNAFLREQKAKGATLGGRFYLDPDLNTAASLAGGDAYYDFDFEPPAPMQGLHLRASRNGAYYSDLVATVEGSTLATAA